MYHEAYMGFGVLQSGHRIWVNVHGRLRDGTVSMARRLVRLVCISALLFFLEGVEMV
jgi:hypothetical protein